MITIKTKGDFNKTLKYLEKSKRVFSDATLDSYGQRGVAALSAATPIGSGETASSWTYEIKKTSERVSISFHNSSDADGQVPVVILLQYGHATKSGTWVEGLDFINPAVKPIFDAISRELWEEVKRL